LAGGTNTVNGGASLSVGAGGMITNGADITLTPAATPGTLFLAGDLTYTGGSDTALIASGPALPGSTRGTLDLQAAIRTFNVADGTQADDLLISARIINGGINKTGAGTLSLIAANDYSGPTTITQGRLSANANSLPAATALTIGQNAILNLNGTNTVGSLSGDSLNPGSVQLNGFALTVGGQTSTSFYGAIAGGGSASLIKQGAGALTLNGDVSGASLTVN